MRMLKKHRFIYLFIIFNNLIFSEEKFQVIESKPIPKTVKRIDFKPSSISGSFANGILLLDKSKRIIIEITDQNNIKFSGGLVNNDFIYGDYIWMDSMPDGVKVLDRLENTLIHLDFNLNYIQSIKLDKNIFPNRAASFPWGDILIHSKVFNGLFLFSNGSLDKSLFINFFKEFGSNICLNDLNINDNGDIGILSCDGNVTIFNQNGMKKHAYSKQLPDSKHLISYNSDWLVFNTIGNAVKLDGKTKYNIDFDYNLILDVKNINKSLAVLTKDHILFMDVN